MFNTYTCCNIINNMIHILKNNLNSTSNLEIIKYKLIFSINKLLLVTINMNDKMCGCITLSNLYHVIQVFNWY